MKYIIAIAFFPLCLFGFQPKASIKAYQLKPLVGHWKGSLTYLDYTSNKPFSLPANISIVNLNSSYTVLETTFSYPDEPKANEKDTLELSKDGYEFDGYKIVQNVFKNGERTIVVQKKDKDGNDNKSATIRKTYHIVADSYSIKKQVHFDGTNEWIIRNTYAFSRITS